MCDKAVNNYSHVLEFVQNYYNTRKLCTKVVDIYLSAIKTQEVCGKLFPKDLLC